MFSRNLGLLNRSGATNSRSALPARIAFSTSSQSSLLLEFSVVAVSPSRPAAWIWSLIRASNGETIRVGPEPRSRISRVAMK